MGTINTRVKTQKDKAVATSKIPQSQQAVGKAKTSGALTMAELMGRTQAKTFYAPQKGAIVEGIITKLTPSEILVDINAKTEAVVLEKEKRLLRSILGNLKVGDKVTVSILNPESDLGHPVVSLRRFLDDISWKELNELKEKKQELEVVVTESTRGGFLVETQSGISGFLPHSQSTLTPADGPGKRVKAFVWELNRPLRKIIFSQKPLLGKEEFEKAIKGFSTGDKVAVTVTNITPFGVFVTFAGKSKEVPSIDGLIHISEISWERLDSTDDLYTSGQTLTASIIGFDKEAKRVDLSVKRLEKDPFEEASQQYKEEQEVSGTVTSIGSQGVILDLGEGVEGMIRKEKIPPGVSFDIGAKVQATVSQIDKKRRKIILVPVLLKKTIGYR